MAKVEFTQEQEKAIIKYLSKKFANKECFNCKHVRGSYYPSLSKICKSCNKDLKWWPDKDIMPFIMKELEEIKRNR